MIQAFNQSGQQALLIGTIRLRLMIEDMMTYVTFHVIDAITSTNLGRPWWISLCTETAKWIYMCPNHPIAIPSPLSIEPALPPFALQYQEDPNHSCHFSFGLFLACVWEVCTWMHQKAPKTKSTTASFWGGPTSPLPPPMAKRILYLMRRPRPYSFFGTLFL